jgi:class 3 adenylate cyclase
VVVTAALFTAISLTPVARYMTTRLGLPPLFALRDQGRSDFQWDNRLKVIAVDDSSFAKMQSQDLRILEYAELITGLGAAKRILIDARMSKAIGSPDEIARAKSLFAKARGKIVTGAYATELPRRDAEPIALDPQFYSNERWLGTDDVRALADQRGAYAYGPAPDLSEIFTEIGHFGNHGDGQLQPFVRLTNGTLLPHLALYAAEKISLSGRDLKMDKSQATLDQGSIVVNFRPRSYYSQRVYRFSDVLAEVRQTGTTSLIAPDDIVLILPNMYTGHTDFIWTPHGFMPGGYFLMAAIQNILLGEFLSPTPMLPFLFLGVSLLGALAGLIQRVSLFASLLSAGSATLLLLSFGAFTFARTILPWELLLPAFLLPAAVVQGESVWRAQKHLARIKLAIAGAVSGQQAAKLMRRASHITFDARERIVSIMFIDVVGFSRMAEDMQPRMAFDALKTLLQTISATVHSFGGVVDKTLGDGLLCYFGYHFDSDVVDIDHAERAVRCAIAIQQANVRRCVEDGSGLRKVFPLRVGINSASVFLGDLGTEEQPEFTVVGNGVNFAKRLEGACTMHSILVGSATYDAARTVLPHGWEKRAAQIKHRDHEVEVFELNPCIDQPDILKQANNAFTNCLATSDQGKRGQNWQCVTEDGVEFESLSCGLDWISVRSKIAFAPGAIIRFSLVAKVGAMSVSRSEQTFGGEVKWCYAEAADVHLMCLVLTKESKMRFMARMREFDGQRLAS